MKDGQRFNRWGLAGDHQVIVGMSSKEVEGPQSLIFLFASQLAMLYCALLPWHVSQTHANLQVCSSDRMLMCTSRMDIS